MKQTCISDAPKFVYAFKNAAFPGLIKIGRTQNVKERLSQLNTACAPSPFAIVAVSPSLDYIRDEKRAHDFFADNRKEGEFFHVSEDKVTELFDTIQKNYESESKQPNLQAQRISENNARKAQANSVFEMILDGIVQEHNNAETTAPNPNQDLQISKKRKLEQEDALFEIEMAERKQRFQKTLREDYTSLCPNQIMDDRAKMMFKDNLLNLAFLQGVPAAVQVVSGEIPDTISEDARPITVRSFALEEGKHYDETALQRIEEIMSSMYEQKYGRKASLYYERTRTC